VSTHLLHTGIKITTSGNQALFHIDCTTVTPNILSIKDFLTYNYITYLLTPWSRVLLEKLTGLQLVKKFPAFYGTRKFITALTSSSHLSLS